jgi:hypothetical protein
MDLLLAMLNSRSMHARRWVHRPMSEMGLAGKCRLASRFFAIMNYQRLQEPCATCKRLKVIRHTQIDTRPVAFQDLLVPANSAVGTRQTPGFQVRFKP